MGDCHLEDGVGGQWTSGDNDSLVVTVVPSGHRVPVGKSYVSSSILVEEQVDHLIVGLGATSLLFHDVVEAVLEITCLTFLGAG